MARTRAVLEIDRGDPPDAGQLLPERPPEPHIRPLSRRSHRRNATVLERGRRPALTPSRQCCEARESSTSLEMPNRTVWLRWLPGLLTLRRYQASWLSDDVVA